MNVISICQPHFLPWLGYFNMIYNCSEFIFLDDVQYNRRSWQNRVHILDNHNLQKKKWISLSVLDYHQKKSINEYKINKDNINYLKENFYQSYNKSKYYSKISDFIIDCVEKNVSASLSELNISLIKQVSRYLNINLEYDRSSKIKSDQKKEYLIFDILKKKKAELYLANDGSLNYADNKFFESKGINFLSHGYIHPIYDQIMIKKKINFVSHLSVVDLLFNLDKDSESIIKEFKIKF